MITSCDFFLRPECNYVDLWMLYLKPGSKLTNAWEQYSVVFFCFLFLFSEVIGFVGGTVGISFLSPILC